jgi:hypothetical protein
MPLLASVAVIILIGAAFGYFYVSASSNISSLNGQVTSLNNEVSSLNLNITAQENARLALQASLKQASTTIVSLTSEVGSLSGVISSQSSQVNSLLGQVSSQNSQINSLSGQISSASSQIASLSSVAFLNVRTTLVNNQNYNLPFNSSTTITSFSVSTGGYLQISGTSNTNLIIAVCYGSTSQSQCDHSTMYFGIYFGYGSATFNIPLMPGPVWINAFNYNAGTATLTVNEWT